MAREKGKLWKTLKHKYKLSVLDETLYVEVLSFKLSLLHILLVLSVFVVSAIFLTTFLIAFTDLREFIPGYPDGRLRQMITQNTMRVDSLEMEVMKRDRYLQAIQMVLKGEDSSFVQEVRIDSLRSYYDTLQFELSDQEASFRTEIEEQERFNLGFDIKQQTKDFYHFFPPVDGMITQKFDEKRRHYGIDVVAKANAKVSSVLDGVVVFTDWTIKTGYVIQVQHSNDLLSIYKHNSLLLKKQGEHVRAGEVLGVVGNTGEESSGPHLHFELWRAGNPLNPEDFIKFK